MKKYDFKKAHDFIEAEKEVLAEATLGMHEDWFWTAETVWENGEYVVNLATVTLTSGLFVFSNLQKEGSCPMDSTITQLPDRFYLGSSTIRTDFKTTRHATSTVGGYFFLSTFETITLFTGVNIDGRSFSDFDRSINSLIFTLPLTTRAIKK